MTLKKSLLTALTITFIFTISAFADCQADVKALEKKISSLHVDYNTDKANNDRSIKQRIKGEITAADIKLKAMKKECTEKTAKADPKFIVANGKSCKQVCSSNNMTALSSGTYKNGKPFYICATNAEGEGERAGYNLEPSWSKTCTVGWGGKEKSYTDYSCFCK